MEKQADQKVQHDSHAKHRELFLGQRVVVRSIQTGGPWVPGTLSNELDLCHM